MLASTPLARKLAAVALPLSALAFPAPAAGAALQGPRCTVTLTRLSYDDPGADDAEFIGLTVEAAGGALALGDSGADAEPPQDAGAPLTLGDCGLDAIELVDGQSGACTVYRTIPLADLEVPGDGAVVICAAGVPFAAACDVTTAGRSALKAGWLQNGPGDGVRLRGTGGDAVEIGYDPPPACFAPTATRLADESGEMPPAGSALDDVNTWCEGRFILLGSAPAALRAPPGCPRPPGGSPGGAPDGSVDGGATPGPVPLPSGSPSSGDASAARSDGGYVPERAPAPRPSPSADDPLFRTDAGERGFPDQRPPPRPPGCSVSGASGQNAQGAPLWALLAGLVIRRLLRRRPRRSRAPRRVLRAGSAARCGSGPSRSPSR